MANLLSSQMIIVLNPFVQTKFDIQ